MKDLFALQFTNKTKLHANWSNTHYDFNVRPTENLSLIG